MSFARLPRRLRFLPLGILWSVVAVWVSYLRYALSPVGGYEVNWPVLIAIVACTSLIATFLANVMLRHGLSSIRWVFNWVITGVASCTGAIAILYLTLFFRWALQQPAPSSWSGVPDYIWDSILGLLLVSMGPVMMAFIGSTVVALVSAPVALIARRLILRRRVSAEPAGGAPQP